MTIHVIVDPEKLSGYFCVCFQKLLELYCAWISLLMYVVIDSWREITQYFSEVELRKCQMIVLIHK